MSRQPDRVSGKRISSIRWLLAACFSVVLVVLLSVSAPGFALANPSPAGVSESGDGEGTAGTSGGGSDQNAEPGRESGSPGRDVLGTGAESAESADSLSAAAQNRDEAESADSAGEGMSHGEGLDLSGTDEQPAPLETTVSRSARNGFTCEPGTFYAITSKEAYRMYEETYKPSQELFGKSSISWYKYHAIAAGSDGMIYSVDRPSIARMEFERYDDSVGGSSQVKTIWHNTIGWADAVGAAVNPVTGEVVFAMYGSNLIGDKNIRISSLNWANQTVNNLGEVSSANAMDGSIAFGPDGSLYILRSDADSSVLWRIDSVDLANGPDGDFFPYREIPLNTALAQLNGMAFDADGSMFVSSQSGAISKIDPVTGASIEVNLDYLDGVRDLATCHYPPVLSVQKNVVERAFDNDQFQVSLRGTSSTHNYDTFTTSSNQSGVDEQKIPLLPVMTGKNYEFKEVLAPNSTSTDLSKAYQSRWECVDALTGQNLGSNTGGTGRVSIPALGSFTQPPRIICTLHNHAYAYLQLQKTDATSGEALAGVKFQLWKDTNANGIVEPATDEKVGDPVETNSNGVINWQNLLKNTPHLVQEITVPPGYQQLSNPVQAIVPSSADSDKPTRIEITNNRLPASVTWNLKTPGGLALEGSTWNLVGPHGQTSVIDCTQSPCAGGDINPEAGTLQISNLAWGDYTLTQTQAPPGFKLDTTTHSVSLGATSLNPVLDIVNQPVEMPQLPNAGGTALSTFLLAGGALLALAGILAAYRLWQRGFSI